jgi:hypothetical protein
MATREEQRSVARKLLLAELPASVARQAARHLRIPELVSFNLF